MPQELTGHLQLPDREVLTVHLREAVAIAAAAVTAAVDHPLPGATVHQAAQEAHVHHLHHPHHQEEEGNRMPTTN